MPSAFLTDGHINAATSLFSELTAAHDIDFALVSGSQAFGLGHGTSDVDLYMKTTDDVPIEARFHQRDGFPVQVNVVTQRQLDQALEWGADDGEYTTANRMLLEVPDDVRKLAIRLSRGHLVHADDQSRAVLGMLSPDVMRRRVIARQARECATHLEDVAGTLSSADRDTAFCSARIAVGHACEAALAACDDLYVGAKFLIRRMRRTPGLREILPQLLSALDAPGTWDDEFDARRFEEWMRGRATLAGYVCGQAVINGWDGPAKLIPPMRLARRGPVRDPFHTLLRFGDGVGLAGPDKGYRVSVDAARLWLSLDGSRTPDEFGDDPVGRGVAQLLKIGAAGAAAEAEHHDLGTGQSL